MKAGQQEQEACEDDTNNSGVVPEDLVIKDHELDTMKDILKEY